MEKALFILRGSPGLGRVVGGFELAQHLQRNHKTKIYYSSYLQGSNYLHQKKIDHYNVTSLFDITSLGIQPVSNSAEELVDMIKQEEISTIFCDGEPLLVIALRIAFPKHLIVSILNPSDYSNSSLRESTINFFKHCYGYSNLIIIHGLKKIASNNPKVVSLNTIIRQEILEIDSEVNTNRISVVFGGGAVNSSDSFYNSSYRFLETIIKVANCLNDFHFDIFWPSFEEKSNEIESLANVTLFKTIVEPKRIYKNEIIIARAGRNTISEILALRRKSLLFAIQGEHRATEQQNNINLAVKIAQGKILECDTTSTNNIIQSIKELSCQKQINYNWSTGNEEISKVFERLITIEN